MSTVTVRAKNLNHLRTQDLSDEHLAELAKNDPSAEEILLNRYAQMVTAIAASYYLQGAEREDIEQEGMVGLWEAIHDYSGTMGCSFRSFARICVTRQIITAVKAYSCQKHRFLNNSISLQDCNRQDEELGQIINIEDTSVPSLDEQMIAGERLLQLQSFIDRTCSRLEIMVLGLFLEGKSYQEISQLCNRSVKSIDGSMQRVRQKLQTYVAAGIE